MNIITLRVLNHLYKVGLTEQELEVIEEETKHKERSGISVRAVRKDKIIGINHDNKHSIFVIKNKPVFKEVKPNMRLLFKTLITFDEIPAEIYTLHEIKRYRALDDTIKYTANNLEELKEKIIERFMDKYPSELADNSYNGQFCGYDEEKREEAKNKHNELVRKQLEAIYWLFGEKCDLQFKDTETKNIAKIVKVFEWKNKRLAIMQEDNQFEKTHNFMAKAYTTETCEGKKISIQAYKPSDTRYNYCDVGREIYRHYDKEIWICDELLGQISETELNLLMSKLDDGYHSILTKDNYEMQKDSIKLQIIKAKKKESEENRERVFREKIENQFGEIGEVIRNGITIRKESITYNSTTLKGDFVEKFISYEGLITRNTLDFLNIYESFIGNILQQESHRLKDIKNISFSLGNIKITLAERNKKMYVNDFGVRADELLNILLNAINYKEQKEYDNFLKDTSRESLRVKNALKNGITFRLVIDTDEDDNCIVKGNKSVSFVVNLKIIKDKGYFVRVGSSDFKIKDMNSLFELQKEIDTSRYYKGLFERSIKLLSKAIGEVLPKEIGEMIKNAEKEYKARVERSELFIENAVKITNAQEISNGYVVKGKSGNDYFVGNDLKVYLMKDGKADKYICIVDLVGVKDKPQHNDFLAKRILALANDIDTQNEIHTIKELI